MHRPAIPANAEAESPRRDSAASAPSVSNLFYLASIGVIAVVIAGVFFGTGFLLLAPHAGGTMAGVGPRDAGPEARSLVPGLFPLSDSDHRPANGELGPAAVSASIPGASEGTVPALPPVLFPVAEEAPGSAAEEAFPHGGTPAVELATRPARGGSPQTSTPSSVALAAPTPDSPNPSLSAAEISNLLEHGDARLRSGDLTSARLFYERAAAGGDGRAALRLGATFDPAFLERAGLRNVKGDAAEARSWYGRALDLGTAEAKRQLNGVETKQGR